jgi:FtsP/CotA-like multicopper oxidase with cupredoxin domain
MKNNRSKPMKSKVLFAALTPIAAAVASVLVASNANAVLLSQCNDLGASPTNGQDAVDVQCIDVTASDGHMKVGDGRDLYFFSFRRVSIPGGVNLETFLPGKGQLKAKFPASSIVGKEGQHVYLNLHNVGMVLRPDLPDAHTIHYHGLPQASTVFDGVPDVSVSPNSMATMTYFYNLVEPGTYIYHCHFEASEHMQMGMIGNLWVEPRQNEDQSGIVGYTHQPGDKYVYNDGDGSTVYQVESPIQLTGFDGEFHDASENITFLPFADMKDDYPMINGRGYPDTVMPEGGNDANDEALPGSPVVNADGYVSQDMTSLVEATSGQKILLRLTNVSIINAYTLTAPGLNLKLVGRGARILRGQDGSDLFQDGSQVTAAGGETMEVIIDTTGVPPGTYFLYTTNLNYLSNYQEDNGGIMTEIRIN